MKNQWYTKKWIAVSLHMLFWLAFFAFPFLLKPVMDSNTQRSRPADTSGFYYLLILNNLIRLLLFYANAYFFIPRFIYRKKYGSYFLTMAAALAFMLVCDRLFFNLFIKGFEHKIWNFFVFNLLPFLFIVIASTAFRIVRDKILQQQLNKE